MKNFNLSRLILLFAFVSLPLAAANEELIEACEQAAVLLQEDDLDGALEEASWCLEGLQQLKQQHALSVFPAEVEGFQGGELNSQKIMGMKMIERNYSKGDEVIEVSLMAGGGASAGLAAIAQFGMSVGDGSGEKMRIQRRTVMVMNTADSNELMVKLKSGGMLTLKSNSASNDSVVAFTKAFPIKELDEALDAN